MTSLKSIAEAPADDETKPTKEKVSGIASIFSCDDISRFVSTIIRPLTSYRGISDSVFYLCEYGGAQFITKWYFYYKTKPEIYDRVDSKVMPPADVEIAIFAHFKREFNDTNTTPCILELVHVHKCETVMNIIPPRAVCERQIINGIHDMAEDVSANLCYFAEKMRAGLAYDRCAFLVMEQCTMTFQEYIRRGINTPVSLIIFKALLFMIIQTLDIIHVRYKGFAHRDLHLDNIMLKMDHNFKFDVRSPKYIIFPSTDGDGVEYAVPYFGVTPKIIDFGHSVLPEEGIVSSVTLDPALASIRSGPDILFTLNGIYLTASPRVDPEGKVAAFLAKLEPNRAYIHYNTEIIKKLEGNIPSCHDMILNKVWNKYRSYHPPPSRIYKRYSPITPITRTQSTERK